MAEFQFFADAEDLSLAAAELFIALSHDALAKRGRFTVALSGGSTPRRLFELLASEPYWRAVPWDRTLIFWGDERAVGPDHEHSNYRMAAEALLNHVPVPEENVIRIRGELGAEQAAEDMRRNLINGFGNETPCFDLALMGLGTDGHTASLFPGTTALEETESAVPVLAPPADPAIDRITLTLPVLNNSRTALFLATGKAKKEVVAAIMHDPDAPDRFPAASVEAQETIWYVDEAAFPA